MRDWFDEMVARARFIERHPWFAGLLAQVEPFKTSRSEDRMSVALHRTRVDVKAYRLYVNVEYFQKHPSHFGPILQHELHHIIYHHLTDPRFRHGHRPELMTLAMEMAANEDIVHAPADVITWKQYADLGMEALQTTRRRYALLCEAERDGRLHVVYSWELDRLVPGWRDSVTSSDRDHPGPWLVRGRLPGRGKQPGGRGQGESGQSSEKVRIERMPSVPPIGPFGCSHDLGLSDLNRRPRRGPVRPTSPEQLEAWKEVIQKHLGGLPGGGGDKHQFPALSKDLPRAFEAAAGPCLPWASILRRVLPRQRTAQATWMRPNRRFPQRIGEVPGRHRRPRRLRLLAVIDTSASMDTQELGRVAREVRRLADIADLVIAEADAAVRRVYPVQALCDWVLGGGDTDFAPVLARSDVTGKLYDAVVYFTDGWGPWPSTPPPIPVLWGLTGDIAPRPPWGQEIRIPRMAQVQ